MLRIKQETRTTLNLDGKTTATQEWVVTEKYDKNKKEW
ncbi:unnamed protein product, partial [marine sediment metagenome]